MPKINLKNVIWKEGKDYVSWNLNAGISSFSETRKKALESLQEALKLYFEDIFSVGSILPVRRILGVGE